MIAVEGLTKVFGEVPAVQDISFSVDKGEILGFLGPNGAGKTTTMRILTCYFPPTEGRATVAGFDVVRDSLEVRKRVGYMPENVPLYTDMPVETYLRFVGDVKSVPRRDLGKRVAEAIEECALVDKADIPIGRLSRGYKQRVGLAQAILTRPDVLILDEPTVGLDPEQIKDIRSLIKRLGEKSTIIFSSHILQEVTLLCSRVIIIHAGRIRAIDTPANLQAQLESLARINVTVEGGEPSRVIDALKGIQGVEHVTGPTGNGKGKSFFVEARRDVDVRRDIAACVVQADWGLLDLHQTDMSLEDIYLRLTAKDVTEDEAPATKDAKAETKGEEA